MHGAGPDRSAVLRAAGAGAAGNPGARGGAGVGVGCRLAPAQRPARGVRTAGPGGFSRSKRCRGFRGLVYRFVQGLLDRLVSMDQGTSIGCPKWQLRWLLSGMAGQMAVCNGAARNSCCTPRQWQHAEPLNPARNTAEGPRFLMPGWTRPVIVLVVRGPRVWRKTALPDSTTLPARRLAPTASPAAAAAACELTTRCSCTPPEPRAQLARRPGNKCGRGSCPAIGTCWTGCGSQRQRLRGPELSCAMQQLKRNKPDRTGETRLSGQEWQQGRRHNARSDARARISKPGGKRWFKFRV